MNHTKPKRGRPVIAGDNATEQLQVRIIKERKRAYMLAARKNKLTLSQWLFKVCDQAANYTPKNTMSNPYPTAKNVL